MGAPINRRRFLSRAGSAGVGAAALLAGCGRIGLIPPTDAELPTPEAQGRVSLSPDSLSWPHGRPGAWFNPWWPNPGSVFNLLRWKLLYRNRYIEARRRPPEVSVAADAGEGLAAPEPGASITWVGHCTFIVKEGDEAFMTDPHFGPRAFWPNRITPPGVPIEKAPPGAFCLLSHNHYDHMDAWTVDRLPAETPWYVPMGLGDWLRARGQRRVTEMDWGQTARHGRWKLTCLPVQHWSNRFGMGRDATLWCAWLIESAERRYFFGGDSGYFHGFAEFGRRFGPIDAAMLAIGAYAPRWMMRYPHMTPAEGYRAFRDLGARWMIPMHWGTFDLTDEPADEPPRALARAVSETGGDPAAVRVMATGERWRLEGRRA